MHPMIVPLPAIFFLGQVLLSPTPQIDVPIIAKTDPTLVTNSLALTANGCTVTLGMSYLGGGYTNSLTVAGCGHAELEGKNLAITRYGRGGQADIRDYGHALKWNATQAGLQDFNGSTSSMRPAGSKLYVWQFAPPLFLQPAFDFMQCTELYDDGAAGDADGLTETCPGEDAEIRSSADYSATYIDRSSLFGIPALQYDDAWWYRHKLHDIDEFLVKLAPNFQTQDISHTLAGDQTATSDDLSEFYSEYSIRFTTDFTTLLWQIGGAWQNEAINSGTAAQICRLIADDATYQFSTGGSLINAGATDCHSGDPDNYLMLLSTGTDPDASFAVGLYMPETGADSSMNAQQTVLLNANGTVNFKEDRRVQSYLGTSFVQANVNFPVFRMQTTTSGLRAPTSLSNGQTEAVTRRLFLLFGTPNQIVTAVAAWRTANHTGDE